MSSLKNLNGGQLMKRGAGVGEESNSSQLFTFSKKTLAMSISYNFKDGITHVSFIQFQRRL
jgi:hypothetical protein